MGTNCVLYFLERNDLNDAYVTLKNVPRENDRMILSRKILKIDDDDFTSLLWKVDSVTWDLSDKDQRVIIYLKEVK